MIKLTIDGVPVEVEEGTTVLAAADAVTGSNNEAGVARMIRAVLAGEERQA